MAFQHCYSLYLYQRIVVVEARNLQEGHRGVICAKEIFVDLTQRFELRFVAVAVS